MQIFSLFKAHTLQAEVEAIVRVVAVAEAIVAVVAVQAHHQARARPDQAVRLQVVAPTRIRLTEK